MKKTVTWIVVADHQHARVYAHEGPGRGLQAIDGMTFDTLLEPSRDMKTDRPGRKPASGGAIRSMTPAIDPHREAGEKFIGGVAKAVSGAAGRKAFERLVLIAPPRALGEFRKALPDKVRKMVTAELNEDQTKTTDKDLADRLGAVLAI
ncbi:MAG: hypothetical protein COW30_10185 [Rhodospirillales bacterium CG15_BIG_FIL_POST_REV_8_21_14_020_66_15]|nr:MAG: hypothetical protein COW30_10185 [Rhodospirillales bacterium CG15_BIG_FIL_POST_REV_8_21_14_020_66_15]